MQLKALAQLLNTAYTEHNTQHSLWSTPDPLQVVKNHTNNEALEKIALFCALFAYGNAKAVVQFLSKCPLHLLNDPSARLSHTHLAYRFQSAKEIETFYNLLLELPQHSLRDTFYKAYKKTRKNTGILEGARAVIALLSSKLDAPTRGLRFLLGNPNAQNSPLKRMNLLLRWLVRKDNIDLGIWGDMIPPSDLVLPLDTHTFTLCKKLGIIKRKSYDLKSALEATRFLQKIHREDPIRYDFALYRIGQGGALETHPALTGELSTKRAKDSPLA